MRKSSKTLSSGRFARDGVQRVDLLSNENEKLDDLDLDPLGPKADTDMQKSTMSNEEDNEL